MLTRSLPFLPIISPRLMYLPRLDFTLPRTILRKRCWSRSILCPTAHPPSEPATDASAFICGFLFLCVAASENACHEAKHVSRANLAVAVVSRESALDDVDFLLGRLVHHARNQARQLNRILLVLEKLQFQRLLQAFVGLVVEALAVDGQGADVVHDLAAEIVLAALRDVDLFLDR